ncbi:hypothetical protein O6H91_13G022800 [Diphasiastrum complanatum]|uniref:Uncharacterized protein n=1 Tax=Diphasiastrum complanatum TaxID=34168 RepID=A0ACC2BSX6_DIPCM|nr:hypothetical protein O6H91_13G022800 [Diphasiastrum complanatum]
MGFRLYSAKEWISDHTQNPYKRLDKEHCFWRKKKTLRLKDTRPKRTSDVQAFEDRPTCNFNISPFSVFARLKTAYVNLLLKAGSIDDITRELFQSMCIHGGRTSSGLTKFEKRYLEHLKRTLEDGQTVVI